MGKRFVRGGAVTTALVVTVLALGVAGAAASPGGDRTVDGCLVVANPTATRHTSCPGAHLAAAHLRHADLVDADLAGADLARADLTGADLGGATLDRASLVDAKLQGATVYAATASAADLTGARLSGDDLTGLDLTGATLVGATLTRADMSGLDLSGLNLSRADLAGANLTGAILNGVVWHNTTCPDGSSSATVGGTCVNDVMVLEGVAIGSDPASMNSTPLSPALSAASSLAFTGLPTGYVAGVGFALVAIGLVLIRLSDAARRRRPSGIAP